MRGSGDQVHVLLYWGGNINLNSDNIGYDRNAGAIDAIRRDCTIKDLIDKIFGITGVNRSQYSLKVSAAHTWVNCPGIQKSRLIDVTEHSLQFFLNPSNEFNCLELYLDFSPIPVDRTNPVMVAPVMERDEKDSPAEDEDVPTGEDEVFGEAECHGTEAALSSDVEVRTDKDEDEDNENDDVIPIASEAEVEVGSSHHAERQVIPLSWSRTRNPSKDHMVEVSQEDEQRGTCEVSWRRWDVYTEESGHLCLGMVFDNKKHMQDAVHDYSVRVAKRGYKVLKDTSTMWRVSCKYLRGGKCSWRVAGAFNSEYWELIQVIPDHTCLPSKMQMEHINLNNDLVKDLLLGMVHRNPIYDIAFVQQSIKDKYGSEISYFKAWNCLGQAIEMVYGTWESSLRNLPSYMETLQKHVPGTIVKWADGGLHPWQDQCHTRYVFWTFKPCIEAYQRYQSVICVDRTQMYVKYRHTMLIALTVDANDDPVPLAFAVVHDESEDSWLWFLRLLSRHVVRGRDRTCLISDSRSPIGRVACRIPDFHPPHGRHCFCLRHIYTEFKRKFKTNRLWDLCWSAGSTKSQTEFEKIMSEIQSIRPLAHGWLLRFDRSKWTLVYDDGWRHGVLTTNLSKCINEILKGARHLPLTALVQLTYRHAFSKQ